MAWSAGISRTQGPHHEAKKLSTTGFPRSASSATGGRPARTSSRVKVLASPSSRSVPGTLPRLSSVVTATPTEAADEDDAGHEPPAPAPPAGRRRLRLDEVGNVPAGLAAPFACRPQGKGTSTVAFGGTRGGHGSSQAAPPALSSVRRSASTEISPVWSPEQCRQGSAWSQERRTRVSSSFRPTEKAPEEGSSSRR